MGEGGVDEARRGGLDDVGGRVAGVPEVRRSSCPGVRRGWAGGT